MNGFPTRAPIELEERPREQQWLVDTLWGEQAVGIVGGEPKCGKSILALDLAVAVAAGVPCLRHFAPARPGPVLLFAAEDAGHLVRKRLHGIARAAGARFETLDIAVIDMPALRLDRLDDRRRLQQTVERVAPRLVVLDPLLRLHGVDENTVADVAPSPARTSGCDPFAGIGSAPSTARIPVVNRERGDACEHLDGLLHGLRERLPQLLQSVSGIAYDW